MKTNILIILILALGFYGCNESEGSQSMDDDKMELSGDSDSKMTKDELAAKAKMDAKAKIDAKKMAAGEGSNTTEEAVVASSLIDEDTIEGQAFILCPRSSFIYTQYVESQTCEQTDGTQADCNCSIHKKPKSKKKGTELILSSLTRESCQDEYIKMGKAFCSKYNSSDNPQSTYGEVLEEDIEFGESLPKENRSRVSI